MGNVHVTSSNPKQGCLDFTKCQYPLETNLPPARSKIAGQTMLFNLGLATDLGEEKSGFKPS